MRYLVAGLLLGALGLVAYQDESKLARIEGRVTNLVTGEPVRKVELTLDGPEERTGETAADGRFVFEGLAPGTYRLTGRKVGYLRFQEYGSPRLFGGTGLTVVAGQNLKDLEFKLTPQAVITGKVLDEEGEPAAGASVDAGRLAGAAGRRCCSDSESGRANDLGEYRIASLAPGRYIVSASPAETHRPAEESAPEKALVQTFYTGTIEYAGAAVVEVQAGQQVTGIDIPLQRARVFRVEGRIAGLSAAPPQGTLQVMLSPRDPKDPGGWSGAGGGGMVRPDGSFQIGGVRPGAYYVTVLQRAGSGRPVIVGRAPLEVAADVKGVVLPAVAEPLQLSGTVRVEGGKKLSFAALHLNVQPAEGTQVGLRPVAVSPDGSFKIEGLFPERYYLTLYGLQETAYLKAVRMGKQNALDDGLDLGQAEGAANVEVVIGTNPGSVEGAVRLDSKPVPGAMVALVPDPARRAQQSRLKTTSADQNGHYVIRGAAPGNYKLYAWQVSLEIISWETDTFRPFESKAVRVTVTEGGAAQADLAPLNAEDEQAQQ